MRNYFMWVGIIAMLALMIYDLKYNVRTAQKETYALEQDLMAERQRLHMVELEWTRLSRPDRIAALAKKHLDLHATESPQLMQPEAAMWHAANIRVEASE